MRSFACIVANWKVRVYKIYTLDHMVVYLCYIQISLQVLLYWPECYHVTTMHWTCSDSCTHFWPPLHGCECCIMVLLGANEANLYLVTTFQFFLSVCNDVTYDKILAFGHHRLYLIMYIVIEYLQPCNEEVLRRREPKRQGRATNRRQAGPSQRQQVHADNLNLRCTPLDQNNNPIHHSR